MSSPKPLSSRTLPPEAACNFRDALRSARLVALKDAEAFDGIVHAIEGLGVQLTGSVGSLRTYKHELIAFAERSGSVDGQRLRLVLENLRVGRNDAVHVGAFARTLTQHAVEAALMLEDALMSEATCVRDFMVSPVVRAYEWMTIGAVRQALLSNSFSWLPVSPGSEWKWVSDQAIAEFLRSGGGVKRQERLAMQLGEAKLLLEPVAWCQPGESLGDVIPRFGGRPLLVAAPIGSEPVGIITPYDCL